LFAASQEIFSRMEQVISSIDEAQKKPRGSIRISVQSNFAVLYLIPIINEFCQIYPEIGFDLNIDDKVEDLRQQQIDISFTVGEIEDSAYYSLPLKKFTRIPCGAIAYLEKAGTPTRLEDFQNHRFVSLSLLKNQNTLSLFNAAGVEETVYLNSSIQASSGLALAELLKSGSGLAVMPSFIVEDLINEGKLRRVLPGYYSREYGVFAVYHQKLQQSSYTIRSFIQFVQDAMTAHGTA
jgi:DNA-binding transcriptional LysR family regulator